MRSRLDITLVVMSAFCLSIRAMDVALSMKRMYRKVCIPQLFDENGESYVFLPTINDMNKESKGQRSECSILSCCTMRERECVSVVHNRRYIESAAHSTEDVPRDSHLHTQFYEKICSCYCALSKLIPTIRLKTHSSSDEGRSTNVALLRNSLEDGGRKTSHSFSSASSKGNGAGKKGKESSHEHLVSHSVTFEMCLEKIRHTPLKIIENLIEHALGRDGVCESAERAQDQVERRGREHFKTAIEDITSESQSKEKVLDFFRDAVASCRAETRKKMAEIFEKHKNARVRARTAVQGMSDLLRKFPSRTRTLEKTDDVLVKESMRRFKRVMRDGIVTMAFHPNEMLESMEASHYLSGRQLNVWQTRKRDDLNIESHGGQDYSYMMQRADTERALFGYVERFPSTRLARPLSASISLVSGDKSPGKFHLPTSTMSYGQSVIVINRYAIEDRATVAMRDTMKIFMESCDSAHTFYDSESGMRTVQPDPGVLGKLTLAPLNQPTRALLQGSMPNDLLCDVFVLGEAPTQSRDKYMEVNFVGLDRRSSDVLGYLLSVGDLVDGVMSEINSASVLSSSSKANEEDRSLTDELVRYARRWTAAAFDPDHLDHKLCVCALDQSREYTSCISMSKFITLSQDLCGDSGKCEREYSRDSLALLEALAQGIAGKSRLETADCGPSVFARPGDAEEEAEEEENDEAMQEALDELI